MVMTPTSVGTIETDFLMDYTEEEPRRLVRFTMDLNAVSSIRHTIYSAGDHGQHVHAPKVEVEGAFALAHFLGRVQTELEARSLFSMEEFKATKPDPGAVL